MAAAKKKIASADHAVRIKEAFGVFLRPIEKFRKNPRRAMETPETTLERLSHDAERALGEQFEKGGPEAFLMRMVDALPDDVDVVVAQRVQEHLAAARDALRGDSVGHQLLALYEAADRAGPISPKIVVAIVAPEDAVHTLSVAAKLCDAERTRGERRARALLEAVPDLVEKMYGRYLRIIWILSSLAEGRWPSNVPEKFGAFVNEAVKRTSSYAGLVDADAAHLRNAVAHRHARYVPSRRVVELHDALRWRKAMSLGELEKQLESLWHASVTVMSKFRVFMATELFMRVEVLRALRWWRDAMRGDAAARSMLDATDLNGLFEREIVRQVPPSGTDLWFLPRR